MGTQIQQLPDCVTLRQHNLETRPLVSTSLFAQVTHEGYPLLALLFWTCWCNQGLAFKFTSRLIRNTRVNCWFHSFWIQCPFTFRSLNTFKCNRCCSLELDVNIMFSTQTAVNVLAMESTTVPVLFKQQYSHNFQLTFKNGLVTPCVKVQNCYIIGYRHLCAIKTALVQ